MVKVYIIYSFIYAIIGWVLEVSYNGIKQAKYINCGVLNGPWCPIYGFAAISILILLNLIDTDSKLFLFFSSMLIASIIELVTGFILEKVFHKKWRDYSDKDLNIGGYICAEYSLAWGALCFILYEAIHPMIANLVESIPYRINIGINIGVSILFLIDLLATINSILGINKKFSHIEKSSEKISGITTDLGEKIAYKGIETAYNTSKKRKEFDQRSKEFRESFSKYGEKRILKAFPKLLDGLEDRGYDFKRSKKEK